jgi:cell division protein FtsI (penicillin-binding protein 3)
MMLDEPKANASTHGYATAGWVSAPAAGKVIARIGPMLGLMPATGADATAIQASLFIPLEPGRPSGAPASIRPAAPAAPAAAGPPVAANKPQTAPTPAAPPPAAAPPSPSVMPARDLRREASLRTADHVGQ